MSQGGFVYMMTNSHHTTIYTGVTSDLSSRIIEHREKFYPKSFTAKYKCTKLVNYQFMNHIESAIEEENRLKGGSRKQKIRLVKSINPKWEDLFIKEVQNW